MEGKGAREGQGKGCIFAYAFSISSTQTEIERKIAVRKIARLTILHLHQMKVSCPKPNHCTQGASIRNRPDEFHLKKSEIRLGIRKIAQQHHGMMVHFIGHDIQITVIVQIKDGRRTASPRPRASRAASAATCRSSATSACTTARRTSVRRPRRASHAKTDGSSRPRAARRAGACAAATNTLVDCGQRRQFGAAIERSAAGGALAHRAARGDRASARLSE